MRGVLLAGGLTVAAAGAIAGGEAKPVRNVDAPLSRISCDELPLKTPTPAESAADARDRPYHALVRIWSFPAREPLDVPIEMVSVVGANASARVAPGEYLFEDIGLGYTAVSYGEKRRGAGPPGPGGRAVFAGRNPLVLARHAITVCDLFVPDEAKLDETTRFRGVVVDRSDGAPIGGASIRCGDVTVMTGDDGRFEFAEPVSWRDVLTRTAVGKDGWRSFFLTSKLLTATWVERVLRTGEAPFTLVRDPEPKPATPLPALEH
jgi:hypothetical protein